MPADSVQLIIDYTNGNIKTVSNEAENELSKAGTKGGKKFSSNFASAAKATLGTLAKIGAAASAVGGIALFKSVKDAASLETINTQFEVMLKSASAAQAQVEELQEFAASTPFQLTGLAEATKQLLSFGVAQKEIVPTLQQLGDIAAGVGTDITELTIPFGRLVSTQKLTLQELDKFADRGVNIYAELAKQTGTSLKDIRDNISKGRVPFEEFTKALTNLTGESGLFFNGMQKQSKTLTGVISTLGDNFFNLSANIGKAFSPIVVDIVNKVTIAIQALNKKVLENFNVFTDLLFPLTKFSEGIVTYVIAPLELMINVAKVVFNGLTHLINGAIAGFADLGLGINKFLADFGLGKVNSELKTFAESTKEVADESGAAFKDSLSKITDFSFADSLSSKNEELRTYFEEQKMISDENKAAMQESLASNTDQIAESSKASVQTLGGIWSSLNVQMKATGDEAKNISLGTAKIIQGGMVKGVSGGIQNITQSLAKGENVFANFGKFLMNLFGDLAIQLGEFWIAKGIAIEAANAVSGTGAIVAGASLIAVGSLMKSFSGGGASASPAAASGGATASPVFEREDEPTGEFLEDTVASTPQTILNINVEGNIRDDEAFTRQLVEDISTEGGKQGLVFNNFATV